MPLINPLEFGHELVVFGRGDICPRSFDQLRHRLALGLGEAFALGVMLLGQPEQRPRRNGPLAPPIGAERGPLPLHVTQRLARRPFIGVIGIPLRPLRPQLEPLRPLQPLMHGHAHLQPRLPRRPTSILVIHQAQPTVGGDVLELAADELGRLLVGLHIDVPRQRRRQRLSKRGARRLPPSHQLQHPIRRHRHLLKAAVQAVLPRPVLPTARAGIYTGYHTDVPLPKDLKVPLVDVVQLRPILLRHSEQRLKAGAAGLGGGHVGPLPLVPVLGLEALKRRRHVDVEDGDARRGPAHDRHRAKVRSPLGQERGHLLGGPVLVRPLVGVFARAIGLGLRPLAPHHVQAVGNPKLFNQAQQ